MLKIKKVALRFIIIFIVLLFSNLNFYHTYALEKLNINDETVILDGGFEIIPDNSGNFLIISYDKNSKKSSVAYLSCNDEGLKFDKLQYNIHNDTTDYISYKYLTANFCNKSLYLTHIVDGNTNLEKFDVDLSQKSYTRTLTMEINGTQIDSPKKIAINNTEDIFILNKEFKSISLYKQNKNYKDPIQIENQNNKIFSSIDANTSRNTIYVLDSFNNLMKYEQGENILSSPESVINAQNFKFLTDNIFFTSDGYICTLNDSKFKLDSKVKAKAEIKNYPTCVTAGFDDNSILAKTNDKTISRLRCSDGAVTGKIELENNISALSTSNGNVIAITKNSSTKTIHLISNSDITEVTPEPNDDENKENNNDGTQEGENVKPNEPEQDNDNNNDETQDGENNKPNEPEQGNDNNNDETQNGENDKPNDTEQDNNDNNNGAQDSETPSDNVDDDSITSDVHFIDTENHVISDISAGTTFAEFKNNLIFNGYDLFFKDSNGKVKTGKSTKISTGYTVTFVKDGVERDTFKLIVKGDVTGTGSLTSRDFSAFVDYLLGKTTLSEAFLQAANINGDDSPDAIDLFLIYRMLQK